MCLNHKDINCGIHLWIIDFNFLYQYICSTEKGLLFSVRLNFIIHYVSFDLVFSENLVCVFINYVDKSYLFEIFYLNLFTGKICSRIFIRNF